MYLCSDVIVILYSKLFFLHDLTSKSQNHKHKTLKIRIPGNRSKVELPYSVSQILRHIKCPNANRVTRMKGGKRHGSERPRKNRAHRHCADSLAQRFEQWQFWSFYYWNRKSRLIGLYFSSITKVNSAFGRHFKNELCHHLSQMIK